MTSLKRRSLRDIKQSQNLSPEAIDFLKHGTDSANSSQKTDYVPIPLSQLKSWENQPRHYFSQVALEQLATDIKEQGLKHPLLVRPKGEGGYEVIAGERRFQAAQLAQLETVPCLIKNLTEREALSEALSENLVREDLNPIEVLDNLLKLLSGQLDLTEDEVINLLQAMKYQWETQTDKAQDINIPNSEEPSQQLVAQTFERFGYNWYSYTCNQLKLRGLPEDLYHAIARGEIEYSKGLRFKTIKDEQLRVTLLEQAIAEGWGQREIEQRLRDIKADANKEAQSLTPTQQLGQLTSRLKKIKPWQINPQQWKKIERNLKSIDKLLDELEGASASQEEQ